MWRTSASLEKAQRSLTSLRRVAARVKARDLAIVFWRVAATLFCLQLLYLAVGNAVLRTQLIQNAVSSSKGFGLDFEGAYTLWPGHVRVRELSLRVEDYNVQFEVALAQADLDISLSELLFKKFHVTRLLAEGTRFRLRHKLIAVGEDAERVAAYPPIRGFADPPYYVGVPSPPLPESEYDLWQVRIENVEARISELWVMEYRFRGHGTARGSFLVKPQRWVQVEPARLDLEDGSLMVGEHRVATHVRGHMTCDIPDMDVQKTHGRGVLEEMSWSIALRLSGGQLEFLRAYLGRFGDIRYGGNAEWLVDLNIARGVIQRGSSMSLRAMPLELGHQLANLSADVMARVGHDSVADSNELVLAVTAPRVAFARPQSAAPPPSLEGLVGSASLNAADLTADMSLGRARVALKKLRAPSLAWFEPAGTQLRGNGEAELQLELSSAKVLSGQVQLRVDRAEVRHGDEAAAGDVRSQLAFSRAADATALEMQKLVIELGDAVIKSGEKRTRPFSMRLDAAGLRVVLAPEASARGHVEAHFSSTEALLPLVLGGPLRAITSNALDLKALDARANVEITRRRMRLDGINARSGNLRLRGHVTKQKEAPIGAFLLSSGLVNVGVKLRDGATSVSPFVSDDWLGD